MSTSPVATLGQQFTIRLENQEAVIREVGAALHSYTVDGLPIVDGPHDPTELMDAYKGSRGHLLMPWPNRVADGKYDFGGASFQLPINEVSRGHASHGFCRVFAWHVEERSDASIRLSSRFYGQVGFPFVFEASLTYSLGETGLTVAIEATNIGERAMPFGVGMHPYVTSGSFGIDDDILQCDAASYLQVDDRMIPTGEPVAVHDEFDLRSGAALRGLELDTPFTGMTRDADGNANVVLTSASGDEATTIWMDQSFEFIMIFTGDTLSNPKDQRKALAVEPMTCAPDAFNNGAGLRVLQPGSTFTGRWGVSHRGRTS